MIEFDTVGTLTVGDSCLTVRTAVAVVSLTGTFVPCITVRTTTTVVLSIFFLNVFKLKCKNLDPSTVKNFWRVCS